jgi:hypothetical protein
MRRTAVITRALAVILSLAAGGQLTAQPTKVAVVNHYVSDPETNTVLFITDFEGTAPDVNVVFYDNDGNIVGTKRVSLPRNATVPVRPYDVVKRKETGNIRIESEGGGIVAEYWQVISTDEANYSVAVPAQPADGYENLVLQHFVSDPALTCRIFLTNPSDAQTSVRLEFNDAGGNLLGDSSGTLGPNATMRVDPHQVLGKKTYGNVHITVSGPGIVGEYWQQEDQKVKDPKTGKTKDMRYTVAVPIQSVASL